MNQRTMMGINKTPTTKAQAISEGILSHRISQNRIATSGPSNINGEIHVGRRVATSGCQDFGKPCFGYDFSKLHIYREASSDNTCPRCERNDSHSSSIAINAQRKLADGGVDAGIGGTSGAGGRLPAGRRGAGASSAASPRLSLANDTYSDTATSSHKVIRFNVTVPSGLTGTDYALVNWVKGSAKDGAGSFMQATLYGSSHDINFPDFQVDSVDADPVYWSSPSSPSRWNYNTVPGGFWASDDPGQASSSERGAVYALKFKIGLYRLADIPTTTTGTISTTAIDIKPWQYSTVVSATGTFSHPSI